MPTELRIGTTTTASNWSATDPWGRISFYSSDVSDSGPKIAAAIDTVAAASSGGLPKLDFKLAQLTTGELASRLTIAETGNVGIGTTSPSSLLHLSTTSAEIIQTFTTSTGTCKIYANNDDFVFDADKHRFRNETGATEYAQIDSSGRLLVGTSTDAGGALLQVNGNRIRVATAKTPASASDTGTAGEICWDANYIYVCTATNTWKRAALSSW